MKKRTISLLIICLLLSGITNAQRGLGTLVRMLFRTEASLARATAVELAATRSLYTTEYLTLSASERVALRYGLKSDLLTTRYLSRMEDLVPKIGALDDVTTPRYEYVDPYDIKTIVQRDKYKMYNDFDVMTLNIQKDLKSKGYNIEADGYYGPKTKEAYAQSKGLKVSDYGDNELLLLAKTEIITRDGGSNAIVYMKKGAKDLDRMANSVLVPEEIWVNKEAMKKLDKFITEMVDKTEGMSDECKNNLVVLASGFRLDDFISFHNKTNNYLAVFDWKNGFLKGDAGYTDVNSLKTALSQKILSRNSEKTTVLFHSGGGLPFGMQYSDYYSELPNFVRQQGAIFISRSNTFSRSFNEAYETAKAMKGVKLSDTKTSVMNGVPKNEAQVNAQGLQAQKKTFIDFSNRIEEEYLKGKPYEVISSKKGLLEEFYLCENDVVFITAHSDRDVMYLGSEKLTLEELKEFPARPYSHRKRICVLLSCHTGDLEKSASKFPLFYTRGNESFAEVLIEKKLFDAVIAPDSKINGYETLQILKDWNQYDVFDLITKLNKGLKEGGLLYISQNLNE